MSIPRETLARYITPGCTFVETGTRWGDRLIAAYELGAGTVQSCETDALMYGIAEAHVADAVPHALFDIWNESSVEFLWRFDGGHESEVAVFLDAHTDVYSPVLEELKTIGQWANKPCVILIDDVRLFRSKQWGISLEEVVAGVKAIGDYDISFDTGIQPEDILVARLKK